MFHVLKVLGRELRVFSKAFLAEVLLLPKLSYPFPKAIDGKKHLGCRTGIRAVVLARFSSGARHR